MYDYDVNEQYQSENNMNEQDLMDENDVEGMEAGGRPGIATRNGGSRSRAQNDVKDYSDKSDRQDLGNSR